MPMRHLPLPVLAALAALTLAFLPDPAAAYIGPGAGLSAIGTLLALLAAVFLAIVGFVWYPVKRLIRAMRPTLDRGPEPAADPAPGSGNAGPDGDPR